MKKNRLYIVFFAVFCLIILLNSCDKTDPPVPVWIEEIEATEETISETDIATTAPTAATTEIEATETTYITETEIEIETGTETEIEEIITANTTIIIAEIAATEPETIPDGPLKTLVILANHPPEPTPEPIPAPVNVVPKPQPAGDGTEKIMALSFDDGPSPYTERLLEILAENDVKATFFIMGYKTPYSEEIIKKTAEQGHEVAGHTWNHPDLRKASDEKIKQELQSTNTAIFNITGIYPQIYRAPYGAFNDRVKNVSKELGLALIQWNIDPNDWKVRNADSVYNNIISSVKDGCIVCIHDTHETTVQAMERVIPDLIAAGYKLVTISELLGSTEPGTVYYYRK